MLPEEYINPDTFEDIEEPSESAMEKINGGWTSPCPRCDGDGIINGEPCVCCGGTGWRR